MASETNSSPTCTNQNVSGGTVAWSNPTRAATQDDSPAECSAAANVSSQDLRALFTFTTVVGTIDGFVAEADIWAANGANFDGAIRLWHGGAVVGDNKSRGAGTLWVGPADSDTYITWGSPTDDWNAGLTAVDTTDGTLGFSIQTTRTGAGGTLIARVDHMRMSVYFTEPLLGGDRGPLRGVMRGVLRCVRTVQGWLGVPPERRWRQRTATGLAQIGAA